MCAAQQPEVPALLLLWGNPKSCFYFRTVAIRLKVKKHHFPLVAPQHRCSLGPLHPTLSWPWEDLFSIRRKKLSIFSIWMSFWCVLDSALAEDCIAPSKWRQLLSSEFCAILLQEQEPSKISFVYKQGQFSGLSNSKLDWDFLSLPLRNVLVQIGTCSSFSSLKNLPLP